MIDIQHLQQATPESKGNNVFSPIIESINKNSKTLLKQWTRPTFYNFKLKSATQKCKTTTSKNN